MIRDIPECCQSEECLATPVCGGLTDTVVDPLMRTAIEGCELVQHDAVGDLARELEHRRAHRQLLNGALFDRGMAARKSPHPIARVERWLREARLRGAPLPDAIALATATRSGDPSVRYVILRGIDGRGFVFFTDARSRKGGELRANPRAALAFYWDATGKQIRIEGIVEELEPDLAEVYWQKREHGQRIAVIASTQSAPLVRRSDLLARFQRLRSTYGSKDVPRPAHWRGFRVVPRAIEFWI